MEYVNRFIFSSIVMFPNFDHFREKIGSKKESEIFASTLKKYLNVRKKKHHKIGVLKKG